MNNKFHLNFILILSLLLIFQIPLFSQVEKIGLEKDARLVNPLYELNVRNIVIINSDRLSENTLTFDLVILHTNLPDSGPFYFAAGQYDLYFNPLISNGGTLTYEIVPNTTDFSNPDAIPLNPSISGNKLKLSRNIALTDSTAPEVSPIYPGTRIIKMKLSTSAPEFANVPLNLAWLIPGGGGEDSTAVYAYIGDSVTNITNDGTFAIDTTNIILPVELNSFSSAVLRNDVILNWSTSSELNNSGFDIERALADNIQNWEKVGYVKGNATSGLTNFYSFEDKGLNSGKYVYRLKQTDFNGNFEYFNLANEVFIGIPVDFNLKQNYPNPFNPSTKIDFDIPSDANASLKIYNSGGKEIQSLVNGFLNSGYYSIQFDASSLPSGVYYYRLESGNFTSTKKLVLLK
jgi:hypothetical protein